MSSRLASAMLVFALLGVSGCVSKLTAPPDTDASVASSTVEASNSDLLDSEGNFTLYVSNQSFEVDPVDIRVEIDGQKAVDEVFEVRDQHNWKEFVLRLAPGRHTLTARSTRGEATLRESFVVTDRHSAVINYWYASEGSGNPPELKHLEFEVFNEPVKFL